MSSPDDPRTWMHAWPDVAALAAGGVALLIRTSTSDGPRRLRVVVADGLGTMALGYALYRGGLGLDASPDLAFASACLGGAMGWEWVRRLFGKWAESKAR